MPIYLRQSTASQEVAFGPFVDDTDGKTVETALSIANTDIKIWKAGATTLASKNSGGATHISGGVYYCVLDATDTDTIGPLVIFITVAGALSVRVPCVVYDENVYDVVFGVTAPSTYAGGAVASVTGNVGGNVVGSVGSVTGNVGGNVTGTVASVVGNVGGNVTGSVGSVASGGITSASFATDAIAAAAVKADAVTKIQNGLATAANLATLQSTADGILDDTGTTGVVVGSHTTGAKAEIEAEATDALNAYDPPTNTEMNARTLASASYATAATQSSHTTAIASVQTDTTAIIAAVDAVPTAAEIWAAGTRTLTAGTNIALAKGTGVTGFNDLDAAGVRDAVGLASANLDTQLAALPTAAETADAVLAGGDIDGFTLEETLKLCLAALAGKVSGGGTTEITIKQAGGNTTRIVATVDASGNRTAVTLNV